MKTNDLMIGDLVTFRGCQNDENPMPIKIVAIGYQWDDGEQTALVKINGEKFCDVIEIDDEIVGIPLTAKILEKNGWKLVSNTPYKLEYIWGTGAVEKFADVRILVSKDHDNVWRWDFPVLDIHLYRGDITLSKFKYLHELQHVLKLCGIDKEIEL